MKNKAVDLAIGMRPSGQKVVLGIWIWIQQTVGAKFGGRVLNENKSRGTQDS